MWYYAVATNLDDDAKTIMKSVPKGQDRGLLQSNENKFSVRPVHTATGRE
jgi:hypothetical protein